MTDGITIINTASGKPDGLNKCPYCGSAEVFLDVQSGHPKCHYCKKLLPAPDLFEEPAAQSSSCTSVSKSNLAQPITPEAQALSSEIHHSGAKNIAFDSSSFVTIECQGCGAEILVNTDETVTKRCHWCRQLLSLENQMPNGAVPDILLPFLLSKDDALAKIKKFAGMRSLFSTRAFKKGLTPENVQGVYLPYLVADTTIHATFEGTAGALVRERYNFIADERTYDIDLVSIGRDFDLSIRNLAVEARAEKREVNIDKNTNYVLNAIMPFDIENAIPYDGNYMKGYTAQRRDTNISEIETIARRQIRDLARVNANNTAQQYSSGIRWEKTEVSIEHITWRSAYLPVYLYSYEESKAFDETLNHYVAVNARTGETMGSIPVSSGKVLAAASIIETITFVLPIVLHTLIKSGLIL